MRVIFFKFTTNAELGRNVSLRMKSGTLVKQSNPHPNPNPNPTRWCALQKFHCDQLVGTLDVVIAVLSTLGVVCFV